MKDCKSFVEEDVEIDYLFLYLFNILADYSVNISYDISNIFPICKRRLNNKPRFQIRSDQEYSLALLQKG